MDGRLKHYFEIGKLFLNRFTVNDCILEISNLQIKLLELIELKGEYQKIVNDLNLVFDKFIAESRDGNMLALNKAGIKNITERMIEDRVKRQNSNYFKQKEIIDESELNLDICKNILMVYYQRKDLLIEVINYMKSKEEQNSCLLNNQEILRKLGIYNDNRET